MKEKRDCKIVQDLLPNYIEKLTNEETNKYITEHLNECKDCKKVLKEMQNDIRLDEAERDKKEVNYIKKFNIKFKLIRNILIIIVVLFIIFVGRKTFILTNMANKASKIEQDNYYLKVTSYSSEVANSSEYYIKDEKYIGKMVRHDLSENTFFKITTYHTDEESLQLTEFGDRKVILSNKLDAMISPISFTSKNFFINLCIALSTSIDKVNLAGRECYIIKDGNTQKFIDIDTGLAIKMIDIENNMTVDYHYEYGVVKDSDIVRPDTSGYELEI